ncbi:hypothetical protein [Emticicia sp. BO119]|uniref:hypothetical protein n=1 Tax=Emticicia sp. BO119 TaxID=2757768 RepID=UPI0015F09EF6|nr:hypothetical protein [Emticicia sp. BO119]MBA4849459.1 hypothetical protein [Emticicia sp. BO119]
MTKPRAELNGFSDKSEPVSIFNIIGQRYQSATIAEKEQFIAIAETKALELGSEQNNFAQMFRQTQSKLPIANVKTYFLHAAHLVWGLEFDLTVKARSKDAKTIYSEFEGKSIAVTIEPVL